MAGGKEAKQMVGSSVESEEAAQLEIGVSQLDRLEKKEKPYRERGSHHHFRRSQHVGGPNKERREQRYAAKSNKSVHRTMWLPDL